jgi:hypothetical protein
MTNVIFYGETLCLENLYACEVPEGGSLTIFDIKTRAGCPLRGRVAMPHFAKTRPTEQCSEK